MRRSTLITRALGTIGLACAATALALVFVRYDAPAPRGDILSALGAAGVAAGAWALACRAAPPLGAASFAARQPSPVPPLPHRLPLPARDVGRATGAVLLILTPFVLTRLAAGSGGVLAGALIIFVFVVTVKALLFARRRASRAEVRRKLHVLSEDARRGELHAVRVRVGEPVRMRYLKRGDKPGELDITQFHWLVLRDGGREIRLGGSHEEVGRAALRLGGQEGWLCWPERWKLIDEDLPAAFVADSGEVIMGLADPEEARPYLNGIARPPFSDRAVRRLPRTAKFSAPVHARILGGALLAALLTAPVLCFGPDNLPWVLDWLLCALAAASVVVFPMRGVGEATQALSDGLSWTVREEKDPSIA
ncbi:hypothetical protein BX257_3306 [Streptomyces sp. 3212.3]|uniref:hypothetical protein n=1 Tax=Streptomyces sp. 3212.3 TaxID=1938846 RepID=UPI000E2457D6|nr:hypothetical protein [Streptomyces sp. 3212.3]REE60757.1 hypothetical protein BX257_3306 [Streptomyces sp. 3212.3]